MGTRFALVGDIHGHFDVLAEALDVARRRWGQFDFVLAAGDVEPNRGYEDHLRVVGPPRYRKVGDFPRVASGDITLGAPLYFIAGNRQPRPEQRTPNRYVIDPFDAYILHPRPTLLL